LRVAADLSDVVHDPVAFEAFYRRHIAAVSRFLARRVADPHLVADLTAEVFHAVLRSAHSYRPDRGSELGWLYGIARNTLANHRRHEAVRLRAEKDAAGRRLLDDDDIACLEERIDAESAARSLYQALSRLPESERAIVELVAVDGLSVHDAAAALGIRPGTARVRLHRARRAARYALATPGTASQAAAVVRALSTGIMENR
jgi:RNA polymerase sigma factor (sigma-70 family)